MRSCILALLIALPSAAAQRLAVLELKNRLPPSVRERFPADYFTDQIREGALGVVDPKKLQIISRENLLVLLKSSGKSLEECEGECEVDTGKRIGADYVISGELVMVGTTVKASLKLHDTGEGNLLAAVTASGRKAEELDKSLGESLPRLLAPIGRPPQGEKIVAADPLFGTISVVTEPPAIPFTVDGKRASGDVEVAPGQHAVVLDDPCYAPDGEKVKVKAKERREVRLQGRVRTAPVTFEVKDEAGKPVEGAAISADGKPAGAEVPVCTQVLSVAAKGFDSWAQRPDLTPGKRATFQVKLHRSGVFNLEPTEGPTTLRELKDVSRAALVVKDDYYDPKRVDPTKMLAGALHALAQSSSGAVVVAGNELRAGGKSARIPPVDSVIKVAMELKKLGAFLADALPADHPLMKGAAAEFVLTQGMLGALDATSSLLTPSSMRTVTESNSGFAGIGAVVQKKAGLLRVQRALAHGPSEGKLQPGDTILEIDGAKTEGVALDQCVALLRGKPDTVLKLLVQRGEAKVPIEIKRGTVAPDPIDLATTLEGNIGFVRLGSIPSNAAARLREAIEGLQAKAPLAGLVLDLRGNPGGYLEQAVQIADYFLPAGPLLSVVGKTRDEKPAKDGDAGESLPLVVLVDDATVSGAEIAAGSLWARGRVLLVGKKTFGRGTVTVLYDNPDGSALKLTVAQYLLAGDRSIEGIGLPPDIVRDTERAGDDLPRDPTVVFARDVLRQARSASREALLGAARKLAP